MNKYLAPLIVGAMALFISGLVVEHLGPQSPSDMEMNLYTYGGAALGAWLAMTYVVRRVAPAKK